MMIIMYFIKIAITHDITLPYAPLINFSSWANVQGNSGHFKVKYDIKLISNTVTQICCQALGCAPP